MFYENYLRLCNDRGITPSAAAVDMGLTKAANTKWAAGKTPRDATLKKIADYFEVTIPYLIGETDDRGQKNSPMPSDGTGDMLDKKISLLSETERAQIERQVDEILIKRLSGQ